MDPRIILRGLIREIEQLDEPLQNARERKKPKAKIADIRHGDFAAFEVPHEIRVLNDSGVRGDLHYAEALLEARVALDSGDDARILEAALLLPTFVKEGRRRCERY